MPPTLTNRELKNKSTGIDMIVPEYQVIPGKIVNTVLYHVIVITRLFYFKTRQHKESDLVQFAVAKKYEDVEDLHTKLVAKFPSVSFPALPRMSLIITEKVLNERKKFLESLLGLIAKTPKLCSSSPLLEFLEVNKICIKQNQWKSSEPEKPQEDEKEEQQEEPEQDIFCKSKMESSDDESEPEDETDFPVAKNKPAKDSEQKDNNVEAEKATEGADIFLKSSGKFSFGSHDVDETNVTDLFIPDEARKSDDGQLFVTEDDPDLLQIDDDLDKLLNVSQKKDNKKQPTPKPRIPAKPDLKPRPTPKPRFTETTSAGDENFLSKPVAPPKPKPRTKPKPGTGDNEVLNNVAPSSSKEKPKANEGSLHDIFDKPTSNKNLFSGVDDDDDEDLFKPELSENVEVDCISKYIEQNMRPRNYEELDLFS